MESNIEVGVLVGRWQGDELHEGHREVINIVRKNHPRVFIFVGQSPLKGTANDPLDFTSRRWMIEDTYPDVEVHRIDDVGDNERWSRDLDRQIRLLIGANQKVMLYGSRKSFIDDYKGSFPTTELEATTQISATEIRRRIGIKAKRSREFRQGMIHLAQNRFPTVYTTVDMAGFRDNYHQLLLGRKPGENLWRFPGGFSDVDSPSFEYDASREYWEEVTLQVSPCGWQYVGSFLVDDWRYRHQVDKIKTLLFAYDLDDINDVTTAEAGDDLDEIRWFTFDSIGPDKLVKTHRNLFFSLLTPWVQNNRIK